VVLLSATVLVVQHMLVYVVNEWELSFYNIDLLLIAVATAGIIVACENLLSSVVRLNTACVSVQKSCVC